MAGAQVDAPRLAFAFSPLRPEALFAPDDLVALHHICVIDDREPLRDFSEAAAAGLLADIDMLVTGRGCPRIDATGDERHRFGALVRSEIERFVKGEPWRHAVDSSIFNIEA